MNQAPHNASIKTHLKAIQCLQGTKVDWRISWKTTFSGEKVKKIFILDFDSKRQVAAVQHQTQDGQRQVQQRAFGYNAPVAQYVTIWTLEDCRTVSSGPGCTAAGLVKRIFQPEERKELGMQKLVSVSLANGKHQFLEYSLKYWIFMTVWLFRFSDLLCFSRTLKFKRPVFHVQSIGCNDDAYSGHSFHLQRSSHRP